LAQQEVGGGKAQIEVTALISAAGLAAPPPPPPPPPPLAEIMVAPKVYWPSERLFQVINGFIYIYIFNLEFCFLQQVSFR